MASSAQAIYAKLAATSGITALVSTRIYPHRQPAFVRTYPMIVYRCGNDETGDRFTGTADLVSDTVDLACIAETYAGARALHDAVKAALNDQRGTWGTIVVQGCFQEGNAEEVSVPSDTDRRLFVVESSYLIWFQT